jgi:hypothetical protein
MHLRNVLLAIAVCTVLALTATAQATDTGFQVRYAANLGSGESYINIVNTGANGAMPNGPGFGASAGNICVNVYAFSPDEQLVSCCSCLITPNGVVNLGVNRDLTVKTLTGVIPTSVTVKLLASVPNISASNTGAGGVAGATTGTNCNNSAATVTQALVLPNGMAAWGTTIHQASPAVTSFQISETPFTPATLSAAELTSITNRCTAILGNGSGFGICAACKTGALGSAKF